MLDSFSANNISDHLRVKLDLTTKQSFSDFNLNSWAEFLVEKENWLDNFDYSKLNLNKEDLVYLVTFLEVINLLFEVARLPIFDSPKILSLSHKNQTDNNISLELEIQLIDHIPLEIYKTVVMVALQICSWIYQNDFNEQNKNYLCQLINKKIIRPFKRFVPAGKSTIPVLKVSHSLGIPFLHLGLGIYQIGWGSKAKKLDRSTCESDSAIGSRISQNKITTANILRRAGLPAPVHQVTSSEEYAVKIAKKIGFPVVVKPNDLDQGVGVSIDIHNEESLRYAFRTALRTSKTKQVIIERQVQGVCHRLFIVNNKLLYAVKRYPISVFGDQNSSIKQLIENQIKVRNDSPPWRQSGIKDIDELALNTLTKLGYSLDSIPPKGQMVPLRNIESTEHGGVDEDLTSTVHPSNLEIALHAPKLLGLNIAGIDIITTDISIPWYENGAIINEVNFAPLLGGAEISKSYLATFFSLFIADNGKIPIKIFTVRTEALDFIGTLKNNDKRCFLLHSKKVFNHLGQEIIMPFNDFKSQIRALLLRTDVDAIAIISNNIQ